MKITPKIKRQSQEIKNNKHGNLPKTVQELEKRIQYLETIVKNIGGN